MICKCKYFVIKDGVLVCSVCGKPANNTIEDKVVEEHETKILKPESKRIKRRKK